MISATLCASLGSGSFFVCLYYADDVNLMVALSSLCITIPSSLGIFILHEQATWNVIVGLLCALAGMIILSTEANEELDGASSISQFTHDSISCILDKNTSIQAKSSYGSLMESEPLIKKRTDVMTSYGRKIY